MRATTSAAVTLIPATDGSHTLFVQARDKAGNRGALVEHKFFVGKGTVTTPATGAVLAKKTALTVVAPPTVTGATYQWRRADADAWVDIPAGHVTSGIRRWRRHLAAGPLRGYVPEAELGRREDVHRRRAEYEPRRSAAGTDFFTGGPAASPVPVRVQLDRDPGRDGGCRRGWAQGRSTHHSATTRSPTTDVSVDSFGSDLTVTRYLQHPARAAETDAANMFGPGWVSGAVVEGG